MAQRGWERGERGVRRREEEGGGGYKGRETIERGGREEREKWRGGTKTENSNSKTLFYRSCKIEREWDREKERGGKKEMRVKCCGVGWGGG